MEILLSLLNGPILVEEEVEERYFGCMHGVVGMKGSLVATSNDFGGR